MKKYLINALVIFLLTFFTNCEEEFRGQYPIDNIPPKPVSNLVVENFPGGSKISYELPDETDILYVQAKYKLSEEGETHIIKSSAFNNSLVIKGFGKSAKSNVEISTVDRSQNESESVNIEIEPFDSPIYEIFDNLGISETFGGIRIQWLNQLQEDVMIGIMLQNEETGEFEYADNFYTTEINGQNFVRGLDSTLVTVGVFVRDIYMNYSDTLIQNVKPLFEEEIPKSDFVPFPLPSFIVLHQAQANMSQLFDGNAYDESGYQFLYIRPGSPKTPHFTFDMKVKAKLSRFKIWPRLSYAFNLHSPKKWEWWGTNDQVAASDVESDGWEYNPAWQKIMECESKRPSGLDVGEPNTSEDTEYIRAGEDFDFPLEAPPVRYLRFKYLESWSGGDGLNLQELSFWGEIIND